MTYLQNTVHYLNRYNRLHSRQSHSANLLLFSCHWLPTLHPDQLTARVYRCMYTVRALCTVSCDLVWVSSPFEAFPLSTLPSPRPPPKTNPIPTTHTPLPSYQTSHPQHSLVSLPISLLQGSSFIFTVPFSTVFFLCFHSLQYCTYFDFSYQSSPIRCCCQQGHYSYSPKTFASHRPTINTRNSNHTEPSTVPITGIIVFILGALVLLLSFNSKSVNREGQIRTNPSEQAIEFGLDCFVFASTTCSLVYKPKKGGRRPLADNQR